MLKILKDRLLEKHEKPARALLRMGFANADLVIRTLGRRIRTDGVILEFRQKLYTSCISKQLL
jgi:hypothetical protein